MIRTVIAAFGGACVGVGLLTIIVAPGPSMVGMVETALGALVIVTTVIRAP
jgi:hypothetical protein